MDCRKCKPKRVHMLRLVGGAVFRCPKCGFEVVRVKPGQKILRPGDR